MATAKTRHTMAVYQRMAEEAAELHTRFGGLPSPRDAADVWTDLWHRDVHHSTAIEGNTLTLRQVEILLDTGQATGNKDLREYTEVQGYADAATWVYAQAPEPGTLHGGDLITMQEVREIHHLALTATWAVSPHPHAGPDESPGSFRRHRIAAFPGGMRPPSWTEVDHLMRGWVDEVCELPNSERPFPEAVAAAHHRFEVIHPFIDGNGRTGRMLVNLMLVRSGYPPMVFPNRRRYLDAMRAADAGGIGRLGELIARGVLDSLHRFVLPLRASDDQLVPTIALADDEISDRALRMAASRGRLRAIKREDNTWMSTRAWRDDYLRSRYKRAAAPSSTAGHHHGPTPPS